MAAPIVFWHSASAYHPRSWTLASSVLLHAAAIALLMMLRPSEPPRATFARVIEIAPPYRNPPVVPPMVKTRSRSASPRRAPGVFRLPEPSPPRPAERVKVISPVTLPESPSIQVAPLPAPAILLTPLSPVRAAGFSSVETAEAKPGSRTLAATGAFGAAAAAPAANAFGQIRSGTFGDASAITPQPRPMNPVSTAGFSAAEILSKPRPAYTEDARRLRIEGEVLLEVLFMATGEVRVLRTIRGLGHGLDENAISAALRIQFHPALRGGEPVDSSAVVHIVFRLAN